MSRYVKPWTSSPRQIAAALCAGAFVFAWCANLQAQPHWPLTWRAPANCPQRDEVLIAVRDIVGAKIFETSSLLADGEIHETSDRFRLTLRITKGDAQEQRTVHAKDCHDLLGASAIVLGVHLKRVAATRTAASTEAERAEKPATSDAPANLSPPRKVRRFWMTLPQAGIVVGSLPKPARTTGISVGWSRDEWRMWVSGRYQLPQTIAASAVPGVAAVVDKYTAEAGVSHSWRIRTLDVAPGIITGVDYLAARSRGEDVTAAHAQQAFAFLGGGMVLRWLVSDWLSVAAGVVGEVPLSRPSLRVQSLGEIAQISPVHLRASLGLEWNF